jgi:hypothetical protein
MKVNGFAQATITAGSSDETTLRDLQLLNKFNSNYSFNVRPIFLNVLDAQYIDSVQPFLAQLGNYNTIKRNNYFTFIAQPIQFTQQYNTHSSWGRNNGALLSVPGYQQLSTAGVSVISKYLDLQLMPEFNSAAKIPTKDGGYSNLSLGQSALRLHLGTLPFSVSLSTENIWWGPGIFNSLMMSNNAPGFNHISLHTNRPWKTPIGIVEFQIISGHLTSNAKLPFENQNLKRFDQVYGAAPSHDTRYFSGMNISYAPVFMKGFSIGLNRMFQYYTSDQNIEGSFIQKYIPVFTSLFKAQAGGLQEDARNRDQLINIFTRYVFPSVHAEIYGEYGWNDHSYNIRDLALNPDHSAAYLVGVRKVFPLNKEKRFTVETELTQLEPTNSDIARGAGNWYVHSGVIEGYTNQNQIMGGGVTPGDNTATLRLSLANKLNMQSITIERYEHDPRFHSTLWTDWSLAVKHQQFVSNKVLISGGIDFVKRRGYQWTTDRPVNFQFSLKAQYFW